MATKRWSLPSAVRTSAQIDVEVADPIALEFLSSGLAIFDFRQPADAMAFQTTMQRRASELRDRGLQNIETVIERQQSMPAEGNNDGLLLKPS
jgi:hypothetical protein